MEEVPVGEVLAVVPMVVPALAVAAEAAVVVHPLGNR